MLAAPREHHPAARPMRKSHLLVLGAILVFASVSTWIARTVHSAPARSQAVVAEHLGCAPEACVVRNAHLDAAPFRQTAELELDTPEGMMRVVLGRTGPWQEWTVHELGPVPPTR